LPETLEALDLTDGKRLAIVADGDGLAALPMVREPDGRWRRAGAGDGGAEALLNVLARQAGPATEGRSGRRRLPSRPMLSAHSRIES
jgi:maltokinase